MAFTKIVPADLDSPRRELSNAGLGIVVALLVRQGNDFHVFLLGVQSSCSNFGQKRLPLEHFSITLCHGH